TSGRPRSVRKLPRRRGGGADPRSLPRSDLGSPRQGQARLRPDERGPAEPEHPAQLTRCLLRVLSLNASATDVPFLVSRSSALRRHVRRREMNDTALGRSTPSAGWVELAKRAANGSEI